MATSAGSASDSKTTRSKSKSAAGTSSPDAVELLKADHRQVEEWFEQFSSAGEDDDDLKEELAARICAALTIHTTIEEEIFYPAFLEATGDTDIHHEAVVEHGGAKNLIEEIADSDIDDEYFDARVKVLSEMIKHHVNEEEQPDGMFDQAKDSDMDLAALGLELAQRKEELTDELAEEVDEDEDEEEDEE
jgi:hemerythrin superfamily protein